MSNDIFNYYHKFSDLKHEAVTIINNYSGKKGIIRHENGDIELKLVTENPGDHQIVIIGRKYGPILRERAIQSLMDAFAKAGGKYEDDSFRNSLGESYSETDQALFAGWEAERIFYLADIAINEQNKPARPKKWELKNYWDDDCTVECRYFPTRKEAHAFAEKEGYTNFKVVPVYG